MGITWHFEEHDLVKGVTPLCGMLNNPSATYMTKKWGDVTCEDCKIERESLEQEACQKIILAGPSEEKN